MVNAIDKVLKATEGQAAPSFDGRLLSAIASFSLKLSLPDQSGEVLGYLACWHHCQDSDVSWENLRSPPGPRNRLLNGARVKV
jgi:hypothetical protein